MRKVYLLILCPFVQFMSSCINNAPVQLKDSATEFVDGTNASIDAENHDNISDYEGKWAVKTFDENHRYVNYVLVAVNSDGTGEVPITQSLSFNGKFTIDGDILKLIDPISGKVCFQARTKNGKLYTIENAPRPYQRITDDQYSEYQDINKIQLVVGRWELSSSGIGVEIFNTGDVSIIQGTYMINGKASFPFKDDMMVVGIEGHKMKDCPIFHVIDDQLYSADGVPLNKVLDY